MEGTGLSGALVKLQAQFVDWLIGRSLRKHFRAVYVRFAAPEVVDSPPSLRFPPLREGNREVGQAPPLREGNQEAGQAPPLREGNRARRNDASPPLRDGNREGRDEGMLPLREENPDSVPPAGRGNLE